MRFYLAFSVVLSLLIGCDGGPAGTCERGIRAMAKNDVVIAIECWQKSAEEGNALAQTLLGDCYIEGKGVTKDASQAAKWWKMAAGQGSVKAMVSLAHCYAIGEGVEQSDSEAVNWWKKAADKGVTAPAYALYLIEVKKAKEQQEANQKIKDTLGDRIRCDLNVPQRRGHRLSGYSTLWDNSETVASIEEEKQTLHLVGGVEAFIKRDTGILSLRINTCNVYEPYVFRFQIGVFDSNGNYLTGFKSNEVYFNPPALEKLKSWNPPPPRGWLQIRPNGYWVSYELPLQDAAFAGVIELGCVSRNAGM